MKVNKIVLVTLLLISGGCFALVKDNSITCQTGSHCAFSDVITHYREKLSREPVSYEFIAKQTLHQVELKKYQMTSQSWSPDNSVSPAPWLHEVDIYIPAAAKSSRALIVVNNGINYENATHKITKPTNFTEEMLTSIARSTQTIVISVSNIPNQYLTWKSDNKPLKEDDSVARSWVLFMQAPEQRELMPLHVPMATAVSQAMRLAKQELIAWDINKFIITGASKRGWSAWLTAISDPEVEAIVPFVHDLLGTAAGLEHMYRSYGGNWPVAFNSYYQQGVDKLIKTPGFARLMGIEDPLQYMEAGYQHRLAITKYIINASGDDFFVPDNSQFYFNKLPGTKSLRIAPNTDHNGILKFAEQSLITFVNRLQNNTPLPELSEILHAEQNKQLLTVGFSERPATVIRWTAKNADARDFRYACGTKFISSPSELSAENKMTISLNDPTSGWEASYLEATFKDGYVATTQVYITPDGQYPKVAPPANGAACQTLPGRGLGESGS